MIDLEIIDLEASWFKDIKIDKFTDDWWEIRLSYKKDQRIKYLTALGKSKESVLNNLYTEMMRHGLEVTRTT